MYYNGALNAKSLKLPFCQSIYTPDKTTKCKSILILWGTVCSSSSQFLQKTTPTINASLYPSICALQETKPNQICLQTSKCRRTWTLVAIMQNLPRIIRIEKKGRKDKAFTEHKSRHKNAIHNSTLNKSRTGTGSLKMRTKTNIATLGVLQER